MNFEYFIAKRIAFNNTKSLSKIIIKVASAATALSIAILICAVVIVEGFQSEIKSKIFGFWGHSQVIHYNASSSAEAIPFVLNDSIKSTWDNDANIKHYQSFVEKAGIIKSKGEIEGIVFKGVGKDFDWNFIQNNLRSGNIINVEDPDNRKVLLSKTIAERLNLNVGDAIHVYFMERKSIGKKLTIEGIYHTGLAEYDKIFCIVDNRFLQEINQWHADQIGGVQIFFKDAENLKKHDEKLFRQLPTFLKSKHIIEMYPNIFDWVNLTQTNKYLILGLVIIVAAFNMMTVLLILILERVNMIGTLKAMGMSSWSIQKVFLYHASYIILIGLLIGNGVGLGIALTQEKWEWIKMNESAYYLDHVPIAFDWTKVIMINIIAVIVINVLLIIPSYLVQRISPIKAIRFD